MMCGGILAKPDRPDFSARHVVDFLYFFIQPARRGDRVSRFNIADIGICTGAGDYLYMGILRAKE
jgi:lipoprotein signal peptidase